MAAPLVLAQPTPGEDPGAVGPALTAVFATVKEALAAERPVVIVLDDRDLLGQGSVVDATIATGLLGLSRALALEGAKPGWSVNVVTHRGEADAAPVREAIEWLGGSGLSGQFLRVGTEQLGKVWP